MFSRIRGLISCQSNTQTIAPTLSPPSSGHVSFAGIDYPLLPLDHQTPLVFQWFERNPDRFGQNEIPIINTQKNPYLNNIINAAIIAISYTHLTLPTTLIVILSCLCVPLQNIYVSL